MSGSVEGVMSDHQSLLRLRFRGERTVLEGQPVGLGQHRTVSPGFTSSGKVMISSHAGQLTRCASVEVPRKSAQSQIMPPVTAYCLGGPRSLQNAMGCGRTARGGTAGHTTPRGMGFHTCCL